jgi:energy-coupling factor transport system ATP-binding protein
MIAELDGVTYSYPAGAEPALREVSLGIAEGSFSLVAGPSAGGKSTFLRLFNGLVPQFHGGRLAGTLRVAGADPTRTPPREMARLVGMVFQEPEAQAVTDTVEEEIAFGMEQHGVPPALMQARLSALTEALGIGPLRCRRLATLSGGERQRVAVAAALALEPQLLVLDEPTSQLDQQGAAAVIAAVAGLVRSGGLTVLLAEHRLARLLPLVDRVVQVETGRVTSLRPRDAAAILASVPPFIELFRRLGLPLPLTVEEARVTLAAAGSPPLRLGTRDSGLGTRPAPGAELLAGRGLAVHYGEHQALADCEFTLHEGEVLALVGPNGAGKSTLFRALTGLIRPDAGEVRFAGDAAPRTVQARTAFAGLVPQDPALALCRDTVREEVAETLRFRGLKGAPPLETWDIAHLANRNPRDVSVGQQQRIAVAAMLAHAPRVWLMDEPTRGMDAPGKARLAAHLRAHAAGGGAAIVATHDIEGAASYATRVIGLEGGRVAFDLPAARAFSADGPLPTAIARLVPGAVALEDLIC